MRYVCSVSVNESTRVLLRSVASFPLFFFFLPTFKVNHSEVKRAATPLIRDPRLLISPHHGNDSVAMKPAEYEHRIQQYESKLSDLTKGITQWQHSYNTLLQNHNALQAKYNESASQNANLQAQIDQIRSEMAQKSQFNNGESSEQVRKKSKQNNNLDVNFSQKTTNQSTEVGNMETDSEQPEKKETRPPPIFVTEISNYAKFSQFLKENEVDSCTHKETSSKQLVLATNTVEEYRKLQSILTEERQKRGHKDQIGEIGFHTYQLKCDRAFVVFIRHLPRTMNPDEIKEALEDLNFAVRRVTNVPKKTDGKLEPLPLFKVELEPNSGNARIYDLNSLLQVRIKVESFKPRSLIPQCSNCQAVGHTKSYCARPPRCLKCGKPHKTAACSLTHSESCTCANCGGPHPANFRGCVAFTTKQKKEPHKAVNEIQKRTNPTPQPTLNTNGKSYATVTRNSESSYRQPLTGTQNPTRPNTTMLDSMYTMMQEMSQKMNTIKDLADRLAVVEKSLSSRTRSISPEWRQQRRRHRHE